MRITTPLALATCAIVLAGCSAPSEPVDPDTPDGETGETSCLVGDWSLDLVDYTAQSSEYLLGLGIPLDDLDIAGHQLLTFTADGYMTISTDLTTSAVLMGQSIATMTQSAGGADWYWDATNDADGDLTLENWAWTVEPGEVTDPAAPPAAPFFDPESGDTIAVACSATSLSLQGSSAPLVGNFTR